MSIIDVICDLANREITEVPKAVTEMKFLRMLYLENNFIETLPEDFFINLAELTWLDLRNNKLKCLPTNIGQHTKLQNLLLQNNELVELPNELGLLQTLRVLQLSGNNISYPPEHVQVLGANGVTQFLRNQYFFKENEKFNESPVTSIKPCSNKVVPIKATTTKSKEQFPVKELLRELYKTPIKSQLPAISVKSLSKPESAENIDDENSEDRKAKKVHKVTKTCSKLSVHSQYTNKYLEKKVRNKDIRINTKELKELWLSKLRDLLTDQQNILQQEKNLTTLNEWRVEKKLKPSLKQSTYSRPSPPYDINAEFDRILSRKDISEPIQKLIKQRTPAAGKRVDIEKFISEVVAELKKLENEQSTTKSSMKCSEDDIKRILNLHKQISSLKTLNDRF